jgi:hypothetical protein
MNEVISREIPHFVCIGAQRSGTTWLYKNLARHDQIFLPPVKELHYFDSLDNTRSRYKQSRSKFLKKHVSTFLKSTALTLLKRERNLWIDLDFWLNYFSGDGSPEWYKSLFIKAANAGKITGEITPAYSILPSENIQRLKCVNPDVKLIYILRNPIERSFSQSIKYFVGKMKLSISEVSKEDIIEFLQSTLCTSRSDYLSSLQNYRQYFQAEHIFICFFDEIREQPSELLTRICHFIGVKPLSDDQVIKEAINSRSYLMGKMPEEVAQFLMHTYEPRIAEMSHELGGYAQVWHKQLLTKQPTVHRDE